MAKMNPASATISAAQHGQPHLGGVRITLHRCPPLRGGCRPSRNALSAVSVLRSACSQVADEAKPAVHRGRATRSPTSRASRMIVGDDDGRRAELVAGVPRIRLEIVAEVTGIEAGGRLVVEHDLGLQNQGAGERDPFLHAAGQSRGHPILDPDSPTHASAAATRSRISSSLNALVLANGKGDVLQDVEGVEQGAATGTASRSAGARRTTRAPSTGRGPYPRTAPSPPSAGSSPLSCRSVRLLPEPERPSTTRHSPRRIVETQVVEYGSVAEAPAESAHDVERFPHGFSAAAGLSDEDMEQLRQKEIRYQHHDGSPDDGAVVACPTPSAPPLAVRPLWQPMIAMKHGEEDRLSEAVEDVLHGEGLQDVVDVQAVRRGSTDSRRRTGRRECPASRRGR